MIERFLITITEKAVDSSISKRRESGVPSFDWLARGLRAVIVGLRFRHSKWRPDTNAGYRFKSIMRDLFEEGKLTKDPTRAKQWLTTRLLTQLANGYISNALSTSTAIKSWDVVFMRLLSWVLQSAVDGRAGDVAMTKGYKTHFLKWQDLRFELGQEGTLESLTIQVTLRNSKYNK